MKTLLDLSVGEVHVRSASTSTAPSQAGGDPVPKEKRDVFDPTYAGMKMAETEEVGVKDSSGVVAEKRLMRPAALCLVFDSKGRVLTVSRPEPPHEMSIPGGHVEDGETSTLAAIRELKEETGIEVKNLRFVAEMKSPADGRPVTVYRAGDWSGEASALEPGTRVAWLRPRALLRQAQYFRDSIASLLGQGAFQMTDAVKLISAEKRDSLEESKFAMPAKRKYPIDTAARTRNAAARLAQAKKAGRISESEYSAAKARIASAAKKFGIESEFNESDKPSHANVHVRVDGLAHGGSIHVRHMKDRTFFSADGHQRISLLGSGEFDLRDVRSLNIDATEVDPEAVGVKLIGPKTWADGSAKKLVWVQLAEVGSWKGHPAGEFELTPATFSEIKRNFERRGLPIQFDVDHYCELDTKDIDPEKGAPSHGWVYRMDNRGANGLWGLTGWLDYARDGIKDGKFAFLSPAIRFDAKDGQTGAKIGARLTSVAITNQPFLTGLDGLKAASLRGDTKTGAHGMSEPLFTLGLAHHPNEYMPKMRACLGLHDLATGAECQDRLDTLRGHYEADRDGDKDGHNEGIKLADHLLPLRDLFGDQALGMTWEDLLDRVEGMIDAAMDEHVAQYHGGAQMTDKPAATETAPTTETNEMDPKLLKDAEEKAKTFEDKAKTAEDKSKALETANAELTAQVTALSDKVKAGEESVKKAEGVNVSNAVLIEIVEAVTAVALKDEKPKEVVLRLVEDNKKLLSEKVKRDEADLTRDVEETIATYADKKGLTLADKPHLMKQARADRESFNALYPPIPADKRHLLRSIVPSEKRPEAEKPILSVSALTSKLMSDKNLSYIDASDAAANIIAGKTTLEDFLGKK